MSRAMRHLVCIQRSAGIAAFVIMVAAWGQTASAGDSPDFEEHVLPLLFHRCFSCHSEKVTEPKGGLRLDSADELRGSGVVVAGIPDKSEMLRRVSLSHDDEDLMPPLKGGGQPLNESEQELLRRWIAAGANTGAWKRFEHRQPPVTFKATPLTRADVPALAREIDALVDAAHLRAGTQPNPLVDDETFVRRVYLDVAGRIPSLTETEAFLASADPDKRAAVIDTLLDGEGYVSHTYNWRSDLLRLEAHAVQGMPGWMYNEWVKESIRSRMPYDEFVRRLFTSTGYIWDDPATGFYLNDLGMPLDHTSNMARVFLGTRIECAQCHDHPFAPITQRDFYQLSSFTYGVSILQGISPKHIKVGAELTAKLDAIGADAALRRATTGLTAPLKRFTTDTPAELRFPKDYAGDPVEIGKAPGCRTPFGDDPEATSANRRAVFADWLTSPRNPRFSRNIANRLWKRLMGAGLIEPVDSLSPVDRPEQPKLLDRLAEMIGQLGFDERAFLAVVLNTRIYQSEAIRRNPEPAEPASLAGPFVRRLSAEQTWDSLLVLLVEDLDERKAPQQMAEKTAEYQAFAALDAEQLIERAKTSLAMSEVKRQSGLRRLERKERMRAAVKAGDAVAVARIHQEEADDGAEVGQTIQMMQTADPQPRMVAEVDPRWRHLGGWFRASELKAPGPLGHFIRAFGQSDRREIDAFSREGNVTHSLALMNGSPARDVINDRSLMRRRVARANGPEAKVRSIYRAVLVRSPTDEELAVCLSLWPTTTTPEKDIAWALVNAPEFLFIQ
jgi:hypothetical protein